MKRSLVGGAEKKAWPICALFPAGALVMAVSRADAWGAEADPPAGPDKTYYTLFNPTPRELMREMNTDRPDKTESPYTVDAGHFQIEADILNYTYDRYNPARTDTRVETVSLASMNLKVGLCNNVDLQLVLETYESVRTHDFATGTVQNNRGFGDVLVRTKWNAWGNDGGASAFAGMPYVKLPTNQDNLGNDSVEGGVIFPFALELPAGWSMGLMTQLDVVHDVSGSGHHPEFLNSVTFGHEIIGKLAGYAEFFSAVSTESGSGWIGTADVGLTCGLTNDIQLDGGVHIGVTRAAEDINPFMGISWRF
jgi:Putative MetA-pathway of phenol degradation